MPGSPGHAEIRFTSAERAVRHRSRSDFVAVDELEFTMIEPTTTGCSRPRWRLTPPRVWAIDLIRRSFLSSGVDRDVFTGGATEYRPAGAEPTGSVSSDIHRRGETPRRVDRSVSWHEATGARRHEIRSPGGDISMLAHRTPPLEPPATGAATSTGAIVSRQRSCRRFRRYRRK